MKIEEKIRSSKPAEVWQEYCGFLDFSIDQYMQIQRRLMEEQIQIWSACPLGQHFLHGERPRTVEEFLRLIPLTTYEDYADLLLQKRDDMLPAPAVIWIKTTWEGGMHPIKLAPYTKGMLENFRSNAMACLILCSATGKKKFELGRRILSGFAPLPYPTGLIGLILQQETELEFLPPVGECADMSFSEKTKAGFKLAMQRGVDYFFSMGSIASYISRSLTEMVGSSSKKHSKSASPRVILRMLRAKARARKENREVLPKDLFRLTGLFCAGTDNRCYKDELEAMWGIRPMELFAGTEPTMIGTETWNRKGLYFFPDACFYEFLPVSEIPAVDSNPDYRPVTFTMDQVQDGERYELIITVLKGGAFARYRTGDVYVCTGIGCPEDETYIPRFQYLDRVSSVIDIAGFTRITQNSIQNAISLARLPIQDWFAAKEFNHEGHPYLHMYVEMSALSACSHALSRELLQEHLAIYFKYADHDYKDLQRILGMDPLEITVVPCGTFDRFRRLRGYCIATINPPATDVQEFLRAQVDSPLFEEDRS